MNDNNFKALYYQIRQTGRKHTEALVIISRKLLKLANALLHKNQVFDASSCFVGGLVS